jgi:hypothetical protein
MTDYRQGPNDTLGEVMNRYSDRGFTPEQFDDPTPTCSECKASKSILVFDRLAPLPVCETCADEEGGES